MTAVTQVHVRVAAIFGIAETLRQAGCDPGRICATVGLDPADLEDPDVAIPLPRYLRLLDEAARASGDRHFGLHFGARFDPANYGAVGFVALNSPTVGAGLLNVGRYLGVVRDNCRVILEVQEGQARLRYSLAASSVEERRHDTEMALARICAGIRVVAGRDWAPIQVLLEHCRVGEESVYRDVFGAPLAFGQRMNALILEQSLLDLKIPTADNRLQRILEGFLEEELSRRRAEPDLVLQVRRRVMDSLSSGVPGIAEVARLSGLSVRTLQRRLGEQDTTYNRLVDDLRHDLAVQYLENRNISVSEIAFLLGYSEASAFDRAFRRRIGISPLEYRRRTAAIGKSA